MKNILLILLVLTPICLHAQTEKPNHRKPVRVYSVPRAGYNPLADVSSDSTKYKYRIKCHDDKNRILFIFDKYKDGKFVEKGENEAPNFSTLFDKNFIFEAIIDPKKDNSIETYVLFPGANFRKTHTPRIKESVPKWKHFAADTAIAKRNVKIPCFIYYEDKSGDNKNEKYLVTKFGNNELPFSADLSLLEQLGDYIIFSYMIIPPEQ